MRREPGIRLITSDAAPEMVEGATRRAAELGLEGVTFQVLDASAIALPDASVDRVICRFAVMLVPDPAVALAEIRRVLRPGGRAALAVWAAPEENDWMTATGRTALELGLIEAPDPEAPGPFRLADEGRFRRLVEAAGLVVESVEDVAVDWRVDSLQEWWDAAGDMSPMLSALRERLTADELAALRAGAERRLARWAAADGTLAVPGLARALTALRP